MSEHFFCVRRTGGKDAKDSNLTDSREGDTDGGKCSVLRGQQQIPGGTSGGMGQWGLGGAAWNR